MIDIPTKSNILHIQFYLKLMNSNRSRVLLPAKIFSLMFGKAHWYAQYLRYSWIILLATHVIQIIRIFDARMWFYSSVLKKFIDIIHGLSNYLWREKSSEQENAETILKSYKLFRLDFYSSLELFRQKFFYDIVKH